jgi:hypothetical protein
LKPVQTSKYESRIHSLLALCLLICTLVGPMSGTAVAASCTNHVFVNAFQTDAQHRGIQADNHTGGPQSTSCFRVSSILLIHAFGTTQVEMGWIIDTPKLSTCNIASSSSDPWLFRFYVTNGGLGHCAYYNSPRPSPGTFYTYKIVRDTTYTDEFHTFFGGTEIGTVIDMTAGGMSAGWATTNAERYYNYDMHLGIGVVSNTRAPRDGTNGIATEIATTRIVATTMTCPWEATPVTSRSTRREVPTITTTTHPVRRAC